MLDTLFKRLYLRWTALLLAFITLLFGLILWSGWQNQQTADSTYLTRMATLLTNQLAAENDKSQTVLAAFEQEMDVSSRLTTANGACLYQSPTLDDAHWQALANDAAAQIASQPAATTDTTTETAGILTSSTNPHTLLMPATIVGKSGTVTHLLLVYDGMSGSAFLQRALPRFIVLWLLAFAALALLHHRLLRKAFAPAETMLQSQKDFIAAASHELKSPLAVIIATMDALRLRTPLPPEADAALQTVDAECTRMAHLSQELLTLATMDAGQWQIQKTPVDAEAVLIHLYDTYEPLCLRAGIQLSLLLADAPLPTVATDRERLLQILGIFLDNAIHYASEGGRIALQATADAKALHFFVIDHGPGIDETDAPHIFDRFYRADRARSDKSHVGLGLSIAQECAKLLGGHVGHSPTPGGGATFFLAIPLH